MSAQQQAGAFVALAGVLDDVYGASGADRPFLVGPDTHSFRDAGSKDADVLAYLAAFARAAGPVLHAVTHHECASGGGRGSLLAARWHSTPHPCADIEIDYLNVLQPAFLDTSAAIARKVVSAIRNVSASLQVYAGEIGPHNGEPGLGAEGRSTSHLPERVGVRAAPEAKPRRSTFTPPLHQAARRPTRTAPVTACAGNSARLCGTLTGEGSARPRCSAAQTPP